MHFNGEISCDINKLSWFNKYKSFKYLEVFCTFLLHLLLSNFVASWNIY